jgi:FHA domain
MNKPLFIELMTAAGDVAQRFRFDQLPIRIGRAYDNDIILDDPYAAAHHAIIELNQLEELTLRDLGSVNAIKQDHHRDNFFVVNSDANYRLGHSELRIRPIDYKIPAEKLDESDHRWDGWRAAIVAVVIITVTALFEQWSSDYRDKNISEYLLTLVGVLTATAGWIGAWSLVNRLLSGRTRFGRHALIAASGLLATAIWETLSSLLAYAFSIESLATFTAHPGIFIGAATIYYHLMSLGLKQSERIKYYVGGITLFASIIVLIQNYQSSHYLRDKLYMDVIYPPAVRLSGEITLEDLSKDIEGLKETADKDRKEHPED